MFQESQRIEVEGLREFFEREVDGQREFVLVDKDGRVKAVPVRMQPVRERKAA